MRIVAAVFADFIEANPGGASQLQTEIAGRSVIARTLARVAAIDGVDARCLFVRARDREPAAAALRGAGLVDRFELLADDPGVRPRRTLVRAARKWSLAAWRGNPLGLTWFDEYVDPPAAALVLGRCRADAVFCFEAHQPLLDPVLASSMAGHLRERQHEAKMCFCQAPPGLAGILLRRECLEDVLRLAIPLGLVLSYRPEIPQIDPITQPACFHAPPVVTHAAARLTGDTRRSRELVARAIAALGESADASAICAWLVSDAAGPAPLPREVELELTTADPLPQTTLRPRGSRVPTRVLDDLAAVERIARELAAWDDSLVVLGGHGDPLQHPHFAEICQILRTAGIYGIAVITPLVEITSDQIATLFASPVDVVEVTIDAFTAQTYRRVHNADALAAVVGNVERLEALRAERRSPQPIIVCSQTRCAASIDELEAFHDHWIRTTGSAVIHGYNESCGELPPDPLLPARPPLPGPCRRLDTRLMLLADGTVPLCGQDFRGRTRLGDWRSQRLAEIWSSPEMSKLRKAHSEGELQHFPLCQMCGEWFRP